MKTTQFLEQHASACLEGKNFALQYESMSDVWQSCQRPDWLLWILERQMPLTKEQSVRLSVAFAETCLHNATAGDPRPKAAIDAAKAWLDNPCEETQSAAESAAWSAWSAWSAAESARSAAWSAAESARSAAWAAAESARSAAWAAAESARSAAWAAHCDLIRGSIPNPFEV